MARKTQYQTKQMSELLIFLKSVPGSHVTVNDICDHFKKEDVAVRMTTMYRHLERYDFEMDSLRTVLCGICSECRKQDADR